MMSTIPMRQRTIVAPCMYINILVELDGKPYTG